MAYDLDYVLVYGITKKGQSCKVCIRKGDFCYMHLNQRFEGVARSTFNSQGAGRTWEGSSTVPTEDTANMTSNHRSSDVYGITKKGLPCKVCLRKGDFCYMHIGQRSEAVANGSGNTGAADPTEAESHRQRGVPGETSFRSHQRQNPAVSFSVTPETVASMPSPGPELLTPLTPTSCTYCIQDPGGYCNWHLGERYRHQTVSESPPAVSKSLPTDTHEAVNKTCRQLPVDTIFGITLVNEPCKRCIKNQDFCHQHTEQKQEGGIILSDTIKHLLVKKMQVDEACKIYGVTKAQEPCKRCIKQCDFCYQHKTQSSRGSTDLIEFVDKSSSKSKKEVVCGKKKDGSICKNCLCHESGFCHQHQKQREVFEQEIATEAVASSSPSLFPEKYEGSQQRNVLRFLFGAVLVMFSMQLFSHTPLRFPGLAPPAMLIPDVRHKHHPIPDIEWHAVPAPGLTSQENSFSTTLDETHLHILKQFSELASYMEDQARAGAFYTSSAAQNATEQTREGLLYLRDLLGQQTQSLSSKLGNSTATVIDSLGLEPERIWNNIFGFSDEVIQDDFKSGTMEPGSPTKGSTKSINQTAGEASLWEYFSSNFLVHAAQPKI